MEENKVKCGVCVVHVWVRRNDNVSKVFST